MQNRILTLVLALWLAPAVARAQDAAQLCLPEVDTAHQQAFAVELRARGYEVQERCDDAAGRDVWFVRLEVPDALADVWIVASRPGQDTRRARVDGPLDTVDAHVLALIGASLLDEEDPPPPAEPAADDEADDEPAEPAPDEADDEAETVPPAPESGSSLDAPHEEGGESSQPPREPPELVRSSRAIGSAFALELGIAAGLIDDAQGTVGATGAIALHLAPWMRLRVPIHFQIWPDTVWEFGTGLALDFLIPLVPSETWLELGAAGRFQIRSPAADLSGFLVGGDLHAAIFQAIGDSLRLFARVEGMGLADPDTGQPHYGFYLSAGLAVMF